MKIPAFPYDDHIHCVSYENIELLTYPLGEILVNFQYCNICDAWRGYSETFSYKDMEWYCDFNNDFVSNNCPQIIQYLPRVTLLNDQV